MIFSGQAVAPCAHTEERGVAPRTLRKGRNMGTIADNGMRHKYVLVRCRDAGVHTGVLREHAGRECVLTEARRLWYWKPLNNAAFLSGVAVDGLEDSSKVGKPVRRLHLTENCEIIECSPEAEKSIRDQKNHNE